MDSELYALAAEIEDRHWWFRGRRAILEAILSRLLPPSDGQRDILEVGCGNGGNFTFLSRFGNVFAVEYDEHTLRRAQGRGTACVAWGTLPDQLPFEGRQFDVVAALDVIEHIDRDEDAVQALRDRLKPGGLLLLTVPAFGWLWTSHDVASHHRRRYTVAQVTNLLEKTGVKLCFRSYFNCLLFPLALGNLVFDRVKPGHSRRVMRVPPEFMNSLLESVFILESHLLPRVQLPFGVSIVACAVPQAAEPMLEVA